MAKHNNTSIYPFDTNVTVNDGLLGFDAENVRKTKNFKVSALVNLVVSQIGSVLTNSLTSGQVIWIEGLTYLFSDIQYWLNSNVYEIESQEVTLPNADSTYSRIDAVYANSNGQLLVLQGQPAPNPVKPLIDNTSQVLITFILVEASASEPSGVSEDIVYSDNLETDWGNSTSGFSAVDFDFEDTPYIGTKCISIKEESTDSTVIRFYKDEIVEYDPSMKLHLYLKVNNAANSATRIDIQLFEDSSGEESTFATINGSYYGFDFNNTSTYQSVVIPLSAMTGLAGFDGINIFVREADLAAFLIDHIRIVSGVGNLVLNNTYLGLADTFDDSYAGKEGYNPEVENGVLVLKRKTKLKKIELTATADQTEFTISDNPENLHLVFEEQALCIDWTYEDGVLTLGNGAYLDSTITVIYYN
jgi:hypothetical protein|tara:strand:+ start:34012 stop:35259 length:1248 start_codon:yes stop_codon:yes gene_type:complete